MMWRSSEHGGERFGGKTTMAGRASFGRWLAMAVGCLGLLAAVGVVSAQQADGCAPTRPDALGPFYVPNAPLRASVGSGYVLSGTARDAASCAPIAEAQIELWLANPSGVYDDDHRATMLAGPEGEYRFESDPPPPYNGRPPHIHIRASAPGYRTLVTQQYPRPGETEASFDLVLTPA